jgi:hypothetical protein
MYINKEEKKDDNSECWRIIGIFSVLLIFLGVGKGSTGSKHPFDDSFVNDIEIQHEILEGSQKFGHDPFIEDIQSGLTPDYPNVDETIIVISSTDH